MTTIKKTVRNFRQGYEDLYQLGNQTVSYVVTDLDKFSKYGITQQTADELKQLAEEVGQDFDVLFLTQQKFATLKKDELEKEVIGLFVDFQINLNLSTTKSPLAVDAFGVSNISNLTASQLAEKAILCYNLLTMDSAHIFGLDTTESFRESLREKGESLRNLIDVQNLMEQKRHLATQVRVKKANELYDKISKIRQTGRKMWASTDYVKSNSYRMPSSKKRLPQSESFEVNPVDNLNETTS